MEQELYKIEHTNMYGKTYFCTLKNDVYMTPLGFKSLERSGWTEYADEHLAFITDSSRLSEMLGENGIKTDFVLCIICLSGKLQVSIDNVSQTVCRHQTMVQAKANGSARTRGRRRSVRPSRWSCARGSAPIP